MTSPCSRKLDVRVKEQDASVLEFSINITEAPYLTLAGAFQDVRRQTLALGSQSARASIQYRGVFLGLAVTSLRF